MKCTLSKTRKTKYTTMFILCCVTCIYIYGDCPKYAQHNLIFFVAQCYIKTKEVILNFTNTLLTWFNCSVFI